MPIDPYAALHALLRAEAVRNSPNTTPNPDTASQAQGEEEDQGAEQKTGQHDR
ncbi:hypothetical protein OG302_21915 [Streptomyces sp. NBC_01283]|uniref:hypothetical protein n=1 Tax=Streptomyces sp. NBC_01283 TaxID=2903812 RepID=UPI00352C2B5B|nr:hypothetical protein OG302_21915 [Streptomyces sp. NBC_01283]